MTRIIPLIPHLFLALLMVVQIAAVMVLNHGTFTYGIDDAYISLRVAENLLLHGHYGINLGEYASPSSSPLWVFLLLPLAPIIGLLYAPLVINITCAFVSVALLQRSLQLVLGKDYSRYQASAMLALCCFVLALDLVGIALLGMEHALQTTLTLAAAYGLMRFVTGKKVPAWLWAVLLIGPLIRYENLAVTGAALLLLLWHGHWRGALLTGALVSLALAGFSYFLHGLGLPLLPSSVLTKLSLRSQFALPILQNLMFAGGMILAFLLALLLYVKKYISQKTHYHLALCAAAVIAAHLLFGSVGWIRYEIYVFAFAIPILLLAGKKVLRRFLRGNRPLVANTRIAASILGIMFLYVNESVTSPAIAARDMYLQQYQVRRFIQEFYQAPVAVNDIGLSSFENSYYILDFAGLANEQSRNIISGKSPAFEGWMDKMAQDHHVSLAIIYDQWFGSEIPKGWVKMAELQAPEELLTNRLSSMGALSFYATTPAAAPEILTALKRFKKTLPDGVLLKLL